MAENGWKHFFDNAYLHNLLFYTQICSMSHLMVSPKVPTTLVTQVVTLWATIATYLSAKMAENGWKQVFDHTYFQNLLFYTQICSMGQQVVLN
jgi:hypothetical protein